MDRRSQVRQCNPIQIRQGKLDCRADRQGFKVLKNALDQIVMLSAPIPSNIRKNNAVVINAGF